MYENLLPSANTYKESVAVVNHRTCWKFLEILLHAPCYGITPILPATIQRVTSYNRSNTKILCVHVFYMNLGQILMDSFNKYCELQMEPFPC